MSGNTFSVGRDCQVVVMGPYGRVDLTHVTGFESRQITASVRVDRIDGTHLGAELPKGWDGQFDLERGNSAAEDFIARLEADFYAGRAPAPGTMYQYITRVRRFDQHLPVRRRGVQAVARRRVEGRCQRQAAAGVLRLDADAAVSDTPSARLIAAAQAAPDATDAAGRRIALRRLTALDKLRLYKAAGPALAQNAPWMGVALLAASVTAIDDIPVPRAGDRGADRGAGRRGSARTGWRRSRTRWRSRRTRAEDAAGN